MPYTDFSVADIETQFRIPVLPGAVFPPLNPVPVPVWLSEILGRTTQLRLVSEKARSEFIVAPILLAVRELSGNRVGIFSGERFDVDLAAGLSGECDFLLTLSPATPIVRAPIVFVVEAKRQDIESGLGQCAAEMIAGRRFDVRQGLPQTRVYGCVTSGEDWQFLRLDETSIAYDTQRFYRSEIGKILAAFLQVVAENAAVAAA